MAPTKRIDDDKAQRLLDAGLSVRETAHACGVSTQALYKAIGAGRLAVANGAAA